MLSKTQEYALRAMIHLARRNGESAVRASELAEAIGIPANYAAKVLHRLGQAGCVISERGRHGGFRLAAPAAQIRLAEVVAPFGAGDESGRCLLGRPECSEQDPCGAHELWAGIQEEIMKFFSETTLADVLERGRGLE